MTGLQASCLHTEEKTWLFPLDILTESLSHGKIQPITWENLTDKIRAITVILSEVVFGP
jgi:hypothetical protein